MNKKPMNKKPMNEVPMTLEQMLEDLNVRITAAEQAVNELREQKMKLVLQELQGVMDKHGVMLTPGPLQLMERRS